MRTYGRCGNFLFQAAACIGYALKHGVDFSLPNKTTNEFWNPLYLQHLVNPDYEQGREDILINESGMTYKEIQYKKEWDGQQVVLNGYWQTEKYFKDYRNEIIYLFDLPYEKKEGYVSVHVRRGDYLRLREKHPEVTKEWYENAMNKFDGHKFKFFSDEIEWCRHEFGERKDCEFSTNSNEIDDITEISCCEHHINSSSTFSWWGAWLNRNESKRVITPVLWFTPGWDGYDTSDIIPSDWLKV